MNSDSPVRRRLPAPISAPMKPRGLAAEPSPKIVSICDAVFHVHHAAGLGERGLAGIELDLDELHVVAEDLVVDFVHARHGPSPPCRESRA